MESPPIALLDDRVLVKPEKETVTKGGIVMPETSETETGRGDVVAVGPGKYEVMYDELRRIPLMVKPGQRVQYNLYGARPIEIGDQKYVVVKESDILGIYPNGKA